MVVSWNRYPQIIHFDGIFHEIDLPFMEPPHIIQFQYIPTPWPHGLWRRWRLALAEAIHVAEEEVGAFHLEARLKGRKTWENPL